MLMTRPGARECEAIGQQSTLALSLVVLCAVGLRFPALSSGIPFALGSDEPAVMDHVVQMMKTGNLHPPFFDYPGLIFYLHLPIACLRFMKGAVAGEWTSLAAADMASFYLWSRAATALLGVGTVVLVYRIGLRWGSRQAWLAALLLAVMPMHVRESRFVLTDVPATFFVTLTLLLSLRAHESGRVAAFAWPGITAGLATAVKFTGGVSLLMPLLAVWLTVVQGRSRAICVSAAAGAFVVGFVAGAPYSLLDMPGFLNGFASLTGHYLARGPDQDYGGWIYLKHLRINFGWPAFLLMFAGLGIGAGKAAFGPHRLRWILLLSFPIVFYYAIADRSPIFGRYLLPVLPFACLLISVTIVWATSLLAQLVTVRAGALLYAALIALALVTPGLMSIERIRASGKPSTRADAYQWIRAHVPAGSRLVIENTALQFPVDLYPTVFVRKLTDLTSEQYRATGAQYLIGFSEEPGATGAVSVGGIDGQRRAAQLLERGLEVARFTSSEGRLGPSLRIIKLR